MRRKYLQVKFCAVGLLALVLTALPLTGHAILKQSTPAPRSVVAGPNINIRLIFNTRVDAAHSRLYLDHVSTSRLLGVITQPDPGTLLSAAQHVPAGEHRILWQALAVDGHITRGELPFTVR